MAWDAVTYLWNRFRPQEGWLALALLLLVIGVMIYSVLAVAWVPEDSVIIPTALLGLLLGLALAKRPISPWLAWTFILLYGLLVTTLTLAHLWPPLDYLFSDWPALRLHWLENGAEFLDRAAGWLTAVRAGSRSNETIIFAYLMGLAAWFLAAYAAWSSFRLHKPLLGLTLMGLFVAVSGYYGEAPLASIIAFAGAAFLATAALHYASLEWSWEGNHVDYSREIRLELLTYAILIGFALLLLAYLLPSFSPSKWARLILNQPFFSDFEESYDRAFAGVEPPRQRPIAPGAVGGAGIMPRSFLLGNPPELERNIMFTARTELSAGPDSAPLSLARHWRGMSYEFYTGRGWTLSEEQARYTEAGGTIPLRPGIADIQIKQDVNWRFDDRAIRYTLGFPLTFDQPVTTYWRGTADYVRAASEGVPRFTALTTAASAAPDQLRQVSLEDIDPGYLARYTNLPDNLPQRIADLAAAVTVDSETPYDQALALEQFLRQYTYSLDVSLPPTGVDAVDHFLFDLQAGYCDYFASAMAVMARSLGLPARIATGFLAQPADDNGVQTVRQINAHSWAEVYFGEYGWVEFEPTPGFVSPQDPRLYADAAFIAGPDDIASRTQQSLPLPERAPRSGISGTAVLWLILGLSLGAYLFWRWLKRPKVDDEVQDAYRRLQNNSRRLGCPLPASQTPHEFEIALLRRLDELGTRPGLKPLIDTIWSPVILLIRLFVQRQYSGRPVKNPKTAVSLWRRIRGPMFLLWLNKLLRLAPGRSERS